MAEPVPFRIPQSAHAWRGFTLLELLVVLTIIAIMTGFAVLAVGDGGERARIEQEIATLCDRLELAADEAAVRGREIGVHLSADGYEFSVHAGDGWQVLAADPQLHAQRFAAPIKIDRAGRAARRDHPDIIYDEAGLASVFELQIVNARDGERLCTLKGTADGHVDAGACGRKPPI